MYEGIFDEESFKVSVDEIREEVLRHKQLEIMVFPVCLDPQPNSSRAMSAFFTEAVFLRLSIVSALGCAFVLHGLSF